ncbi:MAG TPA: VanW family protein [Candidatus Saccharimonadia bacterium]
MAKRKLDSLNTGNAAKPATSRRPKAKLVAAAAPPPTPDQPQLELEDFVEPAIAQPEGSRGQFQWTWLRWPARVIGTLVVLVVLYAASFELTHINKIYPGVQAEGVDLGGLTQADAQARLEQHAKVFTGQVITITQGTANLRIPVASLAPKYDAAKASALAFQYGRAGNWQQWLLAKARSALGRTTIISTLQADVTKLTPYLTQLYDDTVTPVQNAQLAFNNNQAEVTPAQSGARLDMGELGAAILGRLATTSTDAITAPVYQIAASLDTQPLQAAVGQINGLVASPITLQWGDNQRQIDQATIITWINVGAKTSRPFLVSRQVEDLYPTPATADLGLSQTAVNAYVAQLAGGIDQTAQNAGLAMQNGQLAIVQASKNGVKVDRDATVAAINDALKTAGDRTISLKLATTQADVNESNLDSLGIKELISEGETYFPGSPSTRLTNVRTGARRFNGVLLKPGETFSFGALLGDVGPEQGYVPELVILNNHEEKQYGGGLCQVSSTAFRAALAAGLPITERHNHSFAVSYYTWPYAAPGVDATIYYPEVDFKFVNDTGHYLLMQTVMSGYDLKFDFYGTKTKSGVLRGPAFISGTNDATQPSHTVFYRDVLDLAGNVIKTDTFNTYYQSSKDFPITKQFN